MLGRMPIRYAELMGEITGLPPLPIAEMGPPVLTPLRKPLSQARVMIITSAGVRLDSEPPFQHPNDMTFREIEQSTPPERLQPSHPTPVRRPGQADINVVFPYQRMAELAAEGFIGGVTEFHLSMLGSIKKLRELVSDMAPTMAARAKAAGADVILLTPL
jgi:D-proline reductase (dithiol) PrdB